jgi:redox-sensitive bicupin YhaK (pirin superfamily)
MSNISLIIDERPVSIGKFMVGRLLPFVNKRTVGPFAFIDHMGPVKMEGDDSIDVPPHPHIGLSTLTYLFEGSIMHRDTLGNIVEIKPGEVNWMTAGSGIVHSERTPDRLKRSNQILHGLQIWVALPKDLEEMKPEFFHITNAELPIWQEGDVSFKLLAGEFQGRKSKVPVYSKLFFIEIKSKSRQEINLNSSLFGEAGLYILKGGIKSDGNKYEPRHILIANDSALCDFTMEANSTIYIFGGEPFPEPRHIYWNFVATTTELIENAKQKWLDQSFGKIAGETEFVPLPPQNYHVKK